MKGICSSDEIYNLWTMLEQVHSGITLARDRELEQHGLSTIKAAALFIIDSSVMKPHLLKFPDGSCAGLTL